MDQLKQIIIKVTDMRKRLTRVKCGHESNIAVHIISLCEAFTQVEYGKKVKYPETVSVKIENWSNHYFDVRTKDGRWIPEGTSLKGKGLSAAQVYRLMLEESKLEQFRRNLDSITPTDIEQYRKGKLAQGVK